MPLIAADKIRRRFNGSAGQYDQYSCLHREIADRLLVQVQDGMPLKICLDIGCGTGYLTGHFKDRFPQSQVIGLDFSQGMLEVARSKREDIPWILADAHDLPFSNGSFHLVFSNLAYQWAEDLPHVFAEARRVLDPQGALFCTLFGRHTCQELFESLDEASGHSLRFTRLPDGPQVQEALNNSGFKGFNVDSEQVKVEFKDMIALMHWFKYLGAPRLPHEGYLGPGAISRAAAIYQKRFPYLQGVKATFEVIKVYAKA